MTETNSFVVPRKWYVFKFISTSAFPLGRIARSNVAELSEVTEMSRRELFARISSVPLCLKQHSFGHHPRSGADLGGDWGDRPPETNESSFIHHVFLQFGNGIRDIKPFCCPLFRHSSTVKYTWSFLQQRSCFDASLPNVTEINPPSNLTGWIRPCPGFMAIGEDRDKDICTNWQWYIFISRNHFFHWGKCRVGVLREVSKFREVSNMEIYTSRILSVERRCVNSRRVGILVDSASASMQLARVPLWVIRCCDL